MHDDLDEHARLARLRGRARELAADPTGGSFDLFFRDEHVAAFAALDRAKGAFWGNTLFQSTRPFAARAIAAARVGRGALAIERLREMGQWVEGGSVAGHALSLLALFGPHDRLEAHPPLPGDVRELTTELRARLEARNALLRPSARVGARVRLAWLAGEEVGAELYTNGDVEPALAGEVALAAGDLKHADLRFRALASWRGDWLTHLRGERDSRAQGLLGRARVARKRRKLTLALERCDECLALAPTHAGALLLAMALTVRRAPGLAAAYHQRLRAAHPLDDVEVDDLSRDAVERELGALDPRRQAYRAGVAALAARRHGEAASLLARSLEGASASLRGTEQQAAASLLFALAAASRLESLAAQARALLDADASFVSARESLAFALGRVGVRGEAERLFGEAGAGRLFDRAIGFDRWLALPVARSLSPLPVSAEERATSLFMRGATEAGLSVLAAVRVAPDAQVRWLAAGSLWKDHALSPLASKRDAAERAWALIEPLACSERASPHVTELAAEIGAARVHSSSVGPLRASAEQRARSLSDEAWALEQRGEIDAAVATYLLAAEAHPPLGALGLGNAGNLLTARGEHDRALDFLTTALTYVSAFPVPARALVLSQTAHHLRARAMPADALPCESLAFDFAPTAARAARVALDHRALGDEARAKHFCALAERLEPRQPELHDERA